MRQIDEVTPPESAEAAARRTDAFRDGDIDELSDLDTEEAAAEADEEPPAPQKDLAKIKAPRSIRDAKGRGKQEGNAIDDDE